ncbi:MAG: tRNA (guanosine(37)-N1)-methyltransferase TrmD [Candidatus Izemoplasmatales bacterium]|jgi:tRNA (guanine37-N1)-methyltransferase
MKITVLSLFPGLFDGFLSSSIIKRAIQKELVSIEILDFRLFSQNKHHQVDDSPYGGGAGMVLSVAPIVAAVESIEGYQEAMKILLTPQGATLTQSTVKSLIEERDIILICGHYEGFDERISHFIDAEMSIGDYVLTGGEVPAMVLMDAMVRLLPGALGNEASFQQDSFYEGQLDYPQYTRPYDFRGLKVPDVLLSGNHQEIEKWRQEEATKRTVARRPDLLKNADKKD